MQDSEIIEKVARLDEHTKSNTKRIDGHEERIEQLEKTYSIMEKMNYRMEKVETAVEKIDKKMDTKISEDSKEKGKKWDKFIDYIFYAIVGIVLGYIAVKLGLK